MIPTPMGKGEVVATSIRMPRQMRDDLKIQAIRAGRSYNTHAVMILSQALDGFSPCPHQNEQDRQGGNPDGLNQSQTV